MFLIRVLLLAMLLILPVRAQEVAPTADAGSTAAEDLIRILEDDEARAQLIETLRRAAAETSSADAQPEPTAAAEDNEASTAPSDQAAVNGGGVPLSEYTQGVADGAASNIRSLGVALESLLSLFDGSHPIDWNKVGDFLINIGIVIVGLFGSYLLLRMAANATVRQRLVHPSGGHLSRGRKVRALLSLAFLDVTAILLALLVGTLLALYLGTTPDGKLTSNEALLLGTFLAVELSKVLIRLILIPNHPAMRLPPVTDYNAAYWTFWAERVISLLGYTFLFVAPMCSSILSPAVGVAVQVLIMATAVTIAIIIVLQNKDDVRSWLGEMARKRESDGLGRLLAIVGAQWHILVIAYLLVLFVVWFANPVGALSYMVGSTVQSLIAIGLGTLVVEFIGRFVSAGLSLPDDLRRRLPQLETRLQSFVPSVMLVIRWSVAIAVLVAIGQAWGLFDFVGWIGTEQGLSVSGSIVSAALIILIAIVLHVVVASWIEYRLKSEGKAPTAREKTLLNLFKNAFTIVLGVMGLMLVLAQIGVDIGPLLAGAGVVGLAIGFGAQKLVQDIITGIFIQFENVMNEGDKVEVSGRTGWVEKLTIRSVTIRDIAGTVHLIPFSSVDLVSNMMRGFSFYVSEIEIAYNGDIDAAKQAMRDAFAKVMERPEFSDVIIDDLDLPGLIAVTPSSVTLRSRIKTLAGKERPPGRYYSQVLMALLAERGIETPTNTVFYVPGQTPEKKEPPELPPPLKQDEH